MLALVMIIVVMGWALYALSALNLLESALMHINQPIAEWIRIPGNSVRLVLWIGMLGIMAISWVSLPHTILGKLQGEITGIAITVVIIDELVAFRNRIERKQEIYEQLESQVRDVALEAVRLARKYGWLDDALHKVDLKNAELQGVGLVECNLEGVDLVSANLQGAWLISANLKRAHLESANLQDAQMFGVQLQGAFLEMTNLQGAHLDRANLEGLYSYRVELQGAHLYKANLGGALLEKANFLGATLEDANLQGANLTGANLQVTNLMKANLKDAKLVNVSLKGALYNNDTIWPEKINPCELGAINYDELNSDQRDELFKSHSAFSRYL